MSHIPSLDMQGWAPEPFLGCLVPSVSHKWPQHFDARDVHIRKLFAESCDHDVRPCMPSTGIKRRGYFRMPSWGGFSGSAAPRRLQVSILLSSVLPVMQHSEASPSVMLSMVGVVSAFISR